MRQKLNFKISGMSEEKAADMSGLETFKMYLMPLAVVVDVVLMALTIYGGLAPGWVSHFSPRSSLPFFAKIFANKSLAHPSVWMLNLRVGTAVIWMFLGASPSSTCFGEATPSLLQGMAFQFPSDDVLPPCSLPLALGSIPRGSHPGDPQGSWCVGPSPPPSASA